MTKVLRVEEEAENIKSIFFNAPFDAFPGQFIMVWHPEGEEVPMALSYIGNLDAKKIDSKKSTLKGITVEKVGKGTEFLHKLRINDRIGIRGPYGNGFQITGKRILAVAGGTGIATITPAVEYAVKKAVVREGAVVERVAERTVYVCIGAKTRNKLFFLERLKKVANVFYVATDDGSYKGKYSYKGFVSELAEKIVRNSAEKKTEKFDLILTCGPEIMMKKMLLLSLKYKIPLQASLERYIRCGVGICGSCTINGYRVCKEGPVFNDAILKKMSEFGNFVRDSAGKLVKIK